MNYNLRIQEEKVLGHQLITIDVIATTPDSNWYEICITETDPQYEKFHKLFLVATGQYKDGKRLLASEHINR